MKKINRKWRKFSETDNVVLCELLDWKAVLNQLLVFIGLHKTYDYVMKVTLCITYCKVCTHHTLSALNGLFVTYRFKWIYENNLFYMFM